MKKSVIEELSEGSWFDVHTIAVEGVTQYPSHQIDALIRSYQQRCLSLNDINHLLKEITTQYISDGFITSRAFLQPQNLKSGQLTILVVEGTLEALVSAEGALQQRQLHWVFPGEIKGLLNLRDLEQGLEYLNRLQQNQAEMDIEPGAQPGESRVLVRNVMAGAFHGGAGINSSGSAATGEWLVSAWFSWDNPTTSNDNLYLSISDAVDGPDQSKSRSLSLAYSVPYDYGLYSYSASYFEYQQLVQGAAVDFLTSGSSLNHTLNADYTLLRRQRDKVSLSSSITRKQSKNFLEDVFLETSGSISG
jgi:hemolysin activation/secretion protein